MDGNVFLLLTDPDDSVPEVIYARTSSLKVRVYKVDSMEFIADVNEVQLYAYSQNGLLAFQTEDVNADDILDIISAIRWYTRYIGNPEIEILPEDPRLNQDVAV